LSGPVKALRAQLSTKRSHRIKRQLQDLTP
jgi:hypothetical protein